MVIQIGRVITVIEIIWLLSGICSIPMVIQFGIVYIEDGLGTKIVEFATCGIQTKHYLRYVFEMSTFLFFLTPMILIIVLYILIGLAVRRSSTLNRT